MPLVIVDLSVQFVTCRDGASPVLLTFVRNFPGELHVGDHVELHDGRLHVVGHEPRAPGLREFTLPAHTSDEAPDSGPA